MNLAGQGASRGYAMAALLVAMSVMAVLMGALLPVWTHVVTRDKEEELIFRGNQYARAIGLFQRKFANTAPPTIDVLVEQRFLRKKFKDPITNDDFQPIYASQAAQGISAPTASRRPGEQTSASLGTPPPPQQMLQSGFGGTGATAAGGIIGVTSKSKATSIKIYNGRDRYNEWAFVYIQTALRPGGPGMQPGRTGPGQQPGQQQRPGLGQPPGFGPPGFGPQPPGAPGMRPPGMGSPFSPGAGQPSRPPVPFGSPNGSTTFTPMMPGQQPPPPGVRPPPQ